MQSISKKRFIMPFTKQYFHTRDLQKSGKAPQFGSYKYSAQHFYEKGILLSIDQYSPRQFDKLDIILSSNQVGVFTIEVFNNALGITNRVAYGDVKMEELLLAQFENRASFSMFNGLAKFNLNLLLFQINKKCVFSVLRCVNSDPYSAGSMLKYLWTLSVIHHLTTVSRFPPSLPIFPISCCHVPLLYLLSHCCRCPSALRCLAPLSYPTLRTTARD